MTSLIKEFIVSDNDTADKVGSGGLQVLATPTLIAWVENVALQLSAYHHSEEETTVGARIDLQHLAPTPVGEKVSISVVLKSQEGRKLVFEANCIQGEKVIGSAEHIRYIVNIDKFLSKLKK